MSIPPPAAQFCARCGAPNPNGLAQCPHCGQSLLAAAWPPPVGGQPPAQGYPSPQGYPPPDNTLGGLIPYKNGSALAAYYLGVFSIIPCVAIPMGIAAVVLGLRGLNFAKEHPEVKGKTHAWVGIICGGLFGLINIAAVIATLVLSAGGHH